MKNVYVNFLPFFNFICAILQLKENIHYYSRYTFTRMTEEVGGVGGGGEIKNRGVTENVYLFLFVPIFFFFLKLNSSRELYISTRDS